MTAIQTAVVGVGIQGERHAQKLVACEASTLDFVVDTNADRAASVARQLGVEALTDYRDLIGRVDAVAVATPTPTHFEITKTLLENSIHVLLEKPISTAVAEGRELARLAEENSVVLQIGHLERFNPVVAAIAENIRSPVYIESTRIAPYRPRSLDVSVILDLMIHDIDLIHGFIGAPMEHVDAIGRSVFSDNIDIANARIRFSGGCVATVTSSRISMKTERTLRVFEANSYLSADLQHKSLARYTRKSAGPVRGPEDVAIENQAFGDSDAMLVQTKAFLASVAGGPPPLVSGRNATDALETAITIVDAVSRQDEQ